MRKKLIAWLFEQTQIIYTKHFKKKKKPWGLTRSQLLEYPSNSIGYHLGLFLKENNFELLPKVERHDAYHVVAGYGTQVQDEIALQYLCFGNGKRSPYLLGVLFLGTTILPDYLPYYMASYKKGKQMNSFHQYDYKKLLSVSLDEFRMMIFPPNLRPANDLSSKFHENKTKPQTISY